MLGVVVIGLVLSVVMVQGEYFRDVADGSEIKGSVRIGAELLREELQAVTFAGITTATSTQIVFRVPIAMGVVCTAATRGRGAANANVYLPAPGGGISSARVSGWGYLDGDTNEWNNYTATWSAIAGSTGTPAAACAAVGADTTGASSDYRAILNSLSSFTSVQAGEVIQLFTLVEYQISDSVLRPGTKALFRREAGGSLIEYVTGLTTSSRFRYRRQDQTTFQNSITNSSQREEIEEIRIVLEAEDSSPTEETNTYEWDFRVPLRNALEL